MSSFITSYHLRSQLLKVLWITIFWLLVAMLQYGNSYATLVNFNYDLDNLNTNQFLFGSIITGLVAGILGGTCMVFFWEKWLRTKSYKRSLFYIFLSYTAIYLVVATISRAFFYSIRFNIPFFDAQLLQQLESDFSAIAHFDSYAFWLVVVVITLIALLVNDKYGPGVFVDFLMGKYFHPRREERIFMFLDLRGSTAIAEKLGERQYFNFLKEVYKDITPSILNTQGEIYQYVGDEVVISWTAKTAMSNNNAVRCFFDIQSSLLEKRETFRKKYNDTWPEFKAGLHKGPVMAGEIGIIKRDIAYSGDALNTTARIQSKCNELGVNILISKYLLDFLMPMVNNFQPTAMGEFPLRGKQSAVLLYTLNQ